MRQAAALNIDPVAIIARGRDGGLLKSQNQMRRAAVCVRGLDRDGPGGAVGAHAKRPHLTVDSHQRVTDAMGGPFRAWRAGSVDIFDIAPLGEKVVSPTAPLHRDVGKFHPVSPQKGTAAP